MWLLRRLWQTCSLRSRAPERVGFWDDTLEKAQRRELGSFRSASAVHSFAAQLLVRSWRLDRAIMAANLYIRDALGPEYGSVPIELDAAYAETAPNIPVVFLLSLGSDPTANVDALSRKLKISLMTTSMGQGQDVYARRNIQTAQQTGAWVLLQNCHLCLDFMAEIETIVATMKDAHKDFRLWISTEAHDRFPIGLLQASLKIAFEPPQGIKVSGRMSSVALSAAANSDLRNTPHPHPTQVTHRRQCAGLRTSYSLMHHALSAHTHPR